MDTTRQPRRSPGTREGRLVLTRSSPPRPPPPPGAIDVLSKRLTEIYGPPIEHGRRGEMTLNPHHPYTWPLYALNIVLMPFLAIRWLIGNIWLWSAERRERHARFRQRPGGDQPPRP